MKKLTRVKLINWHRFVNTVIEFETSTLLSGENGAGKSTLLDAIQYVITCSTSHFNEAAHENGKRRLTGYVRCKTGKENQAYERTGEISAHVALEFYEEKKKQYFVVGAVVDSASEGQEKSARYLMDKTTLEDITFMADDIPKSIMQFRNLHEKQIKEWCTTDKDAKTMIKGRFGRIDDKFFRLIPKAMAFHPINDIKDFVYSYVLDEREVNIDILRENVRAYQELQKTLESVKLRIGKLEKIQQHHGRVVAGLENDKMYAYYLERAEADILQKETGRMRRELNSLEERLAQAGLEKASALAEKKERQEIRDALYSELASDQDFIAIDEQKKRLARLEARKQELEPEWRELQDSMKRSRRISEELLHGMEDGAFQGQDKSSNPRVFCECGEDGAFSSCIKRYLALLQQIEDTETLAAFKSVLQETIDYKNNAYDETQKRLAELHIDSNRASGALKETHEKIALLQKKKFSYPPDMTRMLDAIKEEFARIGRQAEPKVLCELLEITDDTWRNAVEGYLNTQRFYILVEPDSFDIALGIYDRLRKEKKAFGVGLVNTLNLDQYETAPDDSLAAAVSSANPYARRYINMVLGKVHMCQHYNELKRHKTSITKGCMRYQNHVASAIKPAIYQTPYIGKSAIKVQMQQVEEEKKRLETELTQIAGYIHENEHLLQLLATETETDIKYKIDVLSALRRVKQEIEKCTSNIQTLEKNTNVLQKQLQLAALEQLLTELDEEISRIARESGRIEEGIKNKRQQIKEGISGIEEKESACKEKLEAAGEKGILWQQEYQKQMAGKTPEQFFENYSRRKKANLTTTGDAEKAMVGAMAEYKTAHDFGAAANMEGYPAFAAEYEKLHDSQLLAYEEKVQSARSAAEDEFREQFLSRLQENMKVAQGEFKELNKALKDISFSNEKYEFLYMPSKRHRQYYEMIMDDFNVVGGESLFSGTFHETHKAVIDELFDRLAADREDHGKTLVEFTDYRTYMDYDIKIIHRDGNYSYYSKVCEEKSGGETQTPFYVTVAASFVQLYRANIGGEAIGLVLFDEAFNNMDDERIVGVLEFLRRLPLQIIIAAPPDKIQYISPCVEETQLIMTDEKVSFAERYHNAAI